MCRRRLPGSLAGIPVAAVDHCFLSRLRRIGMETLVYSVSIIWFQSGVKGYFFVRRFEFIGLQGIKRARVLVVCLPFETPYLRCCLSSWPNPGSVDFHFYEIVFGNVDACLEDSDTCCE